MVPGKESRGLCQQQRWGALRRRAGRVSALGPTPGWRQRPKPGQIGQTGPGQPGEGEVAREEREAEAERWAGHRDVCEEGTVARGGQGSPLRQFQVSGHSQDFMAGGCVVQAPDVKESGYMLPPGGRRRDRCMGILGSRCTPSPPVDPT